MMSIHRWQLCFAVALLLGALGLPAPALAQGRGPGAPVAAHPGPGKVAVQLLVVAATDSHDGIDPRLEPLAKHLRFLRYRGYDLLNTHITEISPGGHATFAIAGGRRVTVSLLKKNPERAQFRVEMFSQGGKLLDTTLSVNRNGTFIVAGPKHKDGILILPLQVRY